MLSAHSDTEPFFHNAFPISVKNLRVDEFWDSLHTPETIESLYQSGKLSPLNHTAHFISLTGLYHDIFKFYFSLENFVSVKASFGETFNDFKRRLWSWKYNASSAVMEFPPVAYFQNLKKHNSPKWHKIEVLLLFHSCLCILYRIQLLEKNIIFDPHDDFSYLLEQSSFFISNLANHIVLYSAGCNESLVHIISHFTMISLLDATTNLIIIKHSLTNLSGSISQSNLDNHLNIIHDSLLSYTNLSSDFVSDASTNNFSKSINLQISLNIDCIRRQERIFKNASFLVEYLEKINLQCTIYFQESTVDFAKRCHILYIAHVKNAWLVDSTEIRGKQDAGEFEELPSLKLYADENERSSMIEFIKYIGNAIFDLQ